MVIKLKCCNINYPKDSKYYHNSNNLVITITQITTCGIPIKGFVVLKYKVYTFITEDNHQSKNVKSINKNFVDGN